MMDTTPGPWTVGDAFNVPVGPRDIPENAPSVWLDRLADGATGLELRFCSHLRRERIFADAHLIAAAPLMLKALRAVHSSGLSGGVGRLVARALALAMQRSREAPMSWRLGCEWEPIPDRCPECRAAVRPLTPTVLSVRYICGSYIDHNSLIDAEGEVSFTRKC